MDDLQEWWKHKRHKKAGHHGLAKAARAAGFGFKFKTYKQSLAAYFLYMRA